MYAIIATGGKQFKVEKDQIIKVEKLALNKGDKVSLDVVAFGRGKGACRRRRQKGESRGGSIVQRQIR